MKRYGDSNVIQSDVKSDNFASPQEFNRIVVNNLSEVDQGSLDPDVIIFNKEDDKIYTYDEESTWVAHDSRFYNSLFDVAYLRDVTINNTSDIYNSFVFDNIESNFLTIDPDVFDFGELGSPIDFVIDFWLVNDSFESEGTLLYNGLNTGQVDLEVNKNILITTSGTELVKDPNYQADPTIVPHPEDDKYLNVYYPRLKSQDKILNKYITHVALIRSGETTYLAIDGKINDSAPSVEYFHYDDVKVGTGYYGTSSVQLINLRVSKNTDLGWTEDFVPPAHNITSDGNTAFLMDSTSFVDTIGNYSVTVNGDAPKIIQDKFYRRVSDSDVSSTNMIFNDDITLDISTDNFFCNFITNDNVVKLNYPSTFKFSDLNGINDLIYSAIHHDDQIYSYPTVILPKAIHVTDSMRDSTYNLKTAQSITIDGMQQFNLNYKYALLPIAERFVIASGNSEIDKAQVVNSCTTDVSHPGIAVSAIDMRNGDLIYDTGDTLRFAPEYIYSGWNTDYKFISMQFDIQLLNPILSDHPIFQFSSSFANVGISDNKLYASNISAPIQCDFSCNVGSWYRVYATLCTLANQGSGWSMADQFGSSLYVRNLTTGQSFSNSVLPNDGVQQPHLDKICSGDYLMTNIILTSFDITSGGGYDYDPAVDPSRFVIDDDLYNIIHKIFT